MSEELKPCPFCWDSNGAFFAPRVEAYAVDGNTDDMAWRVLCPGCGAERPGHESVEAAVAAWNARAPSPDIATLTARVAELEREVERVREARHPAYRGACVHRFSWDEGIEYCDICGLAKCAALSPSAPAKGEERKPC